MKNLLVFGAGYCARQAASGNRRCYGRIWGTTRSGENAAALSSFGMSPILFDGEMSGDLHQAIGRAGHILVSIAPGDGGDPVLKHCHAAIEDSRALQWICYLSTIGVYGNHDGKWVNEETPCHPVSRRSLSRLRAENEWRSFAHRRKIPLAIFRLSGIYGPGRNAFVNIETGATRRIVKPGQVFNRIHRDDIAKAFGLAAEICVDGIFNITDDLPAPAQDVVAFAHRLHGSPPPPEVAFEKAQLSEMARSFYGENKRVSNAKSKTVLGMDYEWPDYMTAFRRMWKEGSWRPD